MVLPDFTSVETWISIIALVFMEIVLGIDNIIFVSIVANQLPAHDQPRARNLGMIMALIFRLMLLMAISWVLSLQNPLFTIPFIKDQNIPIAISVKDLILLVGGIFLMYKSTEQVHNKIAGKNEEIKISIKTGLTAVVVQMIVVDIVFSFDSILTAIGMTSNILIMMVAVVIAIVIMRMFTGPVSHFINRHPTMLMLALAFLILIGVMLIAEGLHQHVSKSYIYFAMAFSLGVESLNMRAKKRK